MSRPIVTVASVSGGKDSTAMCLHLREQGIPFRAVHFNTGWEHKTTYDYIANVLPDAIGQAVEIRSREPVLDARREPMAQELEALLGFRSPMVRWILRRGMFMSRTRRFCTQFAARDVMREVSATGAVGVNAIGIRAAESDARKHLPETEQLVIREREIAIPMDCIVWRPILRWTERDVIELHKKHNVPPNPLYLRGSTRVGCWPCINAGKTELRLLAKDDARIQVIERLESMILDLARERFETRPPPRWKCDGCKTVLDMA